MSGLFNKTKNLKISDTVLVANTFLSRLKGLLGETKLNQGSTLWIDSCSSIHTFFMQFPIDAIFVDKRLVVQKCVSNLKPWRMTLPAMNASSVFELPAGTIKNSKTQVGDQLDVVG